MGFGSGGGGSPSISGSSDVVLNNPAQNQLLAYNSTLSKWSNLSSDTFANTRALSLARLDAGLASRTSSPTRVVFTGSSTTAGLAATAPAKRWVNLYTTALQAAYPSGLGTETTVIASTSASFGTLSTAAGIHGYNAGESSTTSANYLTASERTSIAALSPVAIFHMIGSNDFSANVNPATYKSNVAASIADFKTKMSSSRPCVHILVHPYERFDSRSHTYTWAQYGAALKEIADADPTNVTFIDISAAYYAIGIPGANDTQALATGLMASDKIHQNDNGHAFMADLITRAVSGSSIGIPNTSTGGGNTGGGGGTVTPPTSYAAVADTFTRANSTTTIGTADSGQVWTAATGTWGIATSKAYLASGTNGTAVIPLGDTEVTMSCDVVRPSSGIAGIGVRASAGNSRIAAYFDSSDGSFNVGTVYNGALSLRATAAIPGGIAVGTAATVRIDATGSTVTAYLNGSLLLTYTLTSTEVANIKGTDIILRQTVAGSGVTSFDNLTAAKLGSANVLTDSFNRADSTTTLGSADTGQTYTPNTGTWGITNNKAYMASGSAGVASIPAGITNGTVSVDVARPSSGFAGVRGRVTGANSGVTIFMDQAAGQFSLSTIIGGTNSTKTSVAIPSSITVGTMVNLSLSMNGTQLKGYVNGVETLNYTLTSSDMSSITGTGVALRQTVSGTVTSFDNLVVTSATNSVVVDPMPMPVGDLTNWTQIVAEDFDINVAAPNFLNAYPNMRTYDGFYDTSGRGYYSNSTLSVSNSQLVMRIGWNETLQKYCCTEVLPNGWNGQQYGRVDFRMHMDNVSNWKVVPLWWSTRDVWADGEIDFPESGSLGGTFKAYVHKVNTPGQESVNILAIEPVVVPGTSTPYLSSTDQVYSQRWTPTEISFWINDVKVGATTNSQGFPTRQMRFAIQVEVADLSGNTIPAKTDVGNVYVDWVTMYTYAP